MKKENFMMTIAFITIFLILIVLLALSNDISTKNPQINEPSINDLDFDDVSFPTDDDSISLQTNENQFEIPLSKVIKNADPLSYDTNSDDENNTNELPPVDCPDCPPMLSRGPGGSYSGVELFIGETCYEDSCRTECKNLRVGFNAGKCLNNICFCLNPTLSQTTCNNLDCANSCPSKTGYCVNNNCVCTGKVKQVACRTYGNSTILEYGSLLYYTSSNKYESRTYNYCEGNTLVKFDCTNNFLYLANNVYPSQQELENSLLNFERMDCGNKECSGLKSGMCMNSQCQCRYDVSKDFVQDAITNYLMNPNTQLTDDDLSLLTRAHLDPESFEINSDEEAQLGNLIALVKDELENSKLNINYKLLY